MLLLRLRSVDLPLEHLVRQALQDLLQALLPLEHLVRQALLLERLLRMLFLWYLISRMSPGASLQQQRLHHHQSLECLLTTPLVRT